MRLYILTKLWYPHTKLNGVIIQKTRNIQIQYLIIFFKVSLVEKIIRYGASQGSFINK
jgi:hypothetical protein